MDGWLKSRVSDKYVLLRYIYQNMSATYLSLN